MTSETPTPPKPKKPRKKHKKTKGKVKSEKNRLLLHISTLRKSLKKLQGKPRTKTKRARLERQLRTAERRLNKLA